MLFTVQRTKPYPGQSQARTFESMNVAIFFSVPEMENQNAFAFLGA